MRMLSDKERQKYEAAREAGLMDKLMQEYPESDRLEWNRDTDNFDVLRRSDILISDFSGVVFDFSLIYDKPVIYTDPKFNLAPYDAWFLDHPLWTLSALPRIGQELNMETMTDIKSLIDSTLESEQYALGRKEVKDEVWAYFGEGAVRTADYLMEKYAELTAERSDEHVGV